MKRIYRYLKGTNNKALVFNISNKIVVSFYVDAGFAGQCVHEGK